MLHLARVGWAAGSQDCKDMPSNKVSRMKDAQELRAAGCKMAKRKTVTVMLPRSLVATKGPVDLSLMHTVS